MTNKNSSKIGYSVSFDSLSYLLTAKKPQVIDSIFIQIFKTRFGKIPPIITTSLMNALQITQEQAEELVDSTREMIKIAVYENSSNLGALFPKEFHPELKTLILKIIGAHLSEWRESCAFSQCSLPHLKSLDWRIDVKRASEQMTSMSIPTVLVQLQIEKQPQKISEPMNIDFVNFELNKQTLQTMIDGLQQIKEQLTSLKS